MSATDEPFSLADHEREDEDLFSKRRDDDDIAAAITTGARFATRRKRMSMFDEEEADAEAGDVASLGASGAGAPAAAALDDLDLEKVLAAFAPDDSDESRGPDAPFFASPGADDDFDRWTHSSTVDAAIALFGADDDDDPLFVDAEHHRAKHQKLAAQHAQSYQQRLIATAAAAAAAEDAPSVAAPAATPIFFSPNYAPSNSAGQAASRARSASSAAASRANSATTSPKPAAAAAVPAQKDAAAKAAAAATANVSAAPDAAPVDAAPAAGEASSIAGASASPPVPDAAYAAWHRQYLLDQQVQERIDRHWLTAGSEEYKARAKFMKAFSGLAKKPTSLLRSTRKFLDSFAAYIEKKRCATLREELVTTGGGLLTPRQFDDSFHARVERSAEVAILMPVMNKLIAVAGALPTGHESDAIVVRQCALLKDRPQAHFGIPPQNQSPSNWQHAQNELAQLQKFDLPADKIEVLLGTAKAIYQTYQHEAKVKAETAAAEAAAAAKAAGVELPADTTTDKPTSTMFLPADDLFPIFVYIVSQTCLSHPCTLKTVLWDLSDPNQLSGEGGYYLTVFDAAVEYIKKVDTTQTMCGPANEKKK